MSKLGMIIMKRLSLILYGLILSGIIVIPVVAADCPTVVKQALAATDAICQETGKNEACYGNIRLKATPLSSSANFTFSQPGDHVDVSNIKSLQLSPMMIDTGEWGVALMNIEANLPAAKPANVTLLAFGDVTLENSVPTATMMDVSTLGQSAINVRLVPNLKAGVVGTVKPSQTVTALERLTDSSWIRVKLADSEQTGWVKSEFMSAKGDLSALNIVNASQPHYRPMQAFTFKSGNESQSCAEIPKDGLIIQTPEGSGEVQLWINQVVVKLGSTVYFQAQPSGNMTITTVEGHATVTSNGVTRTAVAGSSIQIKMDADMNPVSSPSLPQAYDMTDVENLPIENLGRKISIHAPLTVAEIATVQQEQSTPICPANCPPDANGNSGNNGNSGSNGNSDNCPGNSCHNGTNNNNNGNSDNCPGNSCHNGTNNNNGNGGNNGNADGNGNGKKSG